MGTQLAHGLYNHTLLDANSAWHHRADERPKPQITMLLGQ